MTRALYVAAGGGGDVIAAAIVAGAHDPARPSVIATLSWDRLIVDPLPGPRSARDFSGLVVHGPDCLEVAATTRPVPPAGSLLPRLAAELPARLFLIDPSEGATGIGRQLRAIALVVAASELMLVDVGGDLATDGSEPGVRSPLADSLMLAGCLNSDLPTTALVCGPGLDGELTEQQVRARCRALGGSDPAPVTAGHVRAFRPLFEWHPSEATGLLVASAMGRRGLVEIRDAGSQVPMTAHSPTVTVIPPSRVDQMNPYSPRLVSSRSLSEVDEVMRTLRGSTELDYEREKIAGRARKPSGAPSVAEIDVVTESAQARGVEFVTIRRLAEAIGLTSVDTYELVGLLARHDAPRLDPPLWDVRKRPGR